MSAPPEARQYDPAVEPSAAAMSLADGLLLALDEPALLVTAHGSIVSANGAAASLLGTPRAMLSGAPLADHLLDDPASVTAFLASCARTRAPLPGAFHHRPPATGPARQRVAGGVVQPASAGAPALILLRFFPTEGASNRFTFLNRQLAELTREVRARRTAEVALIEANERLHEQALEVELANQQLQDQALELEHQIESAGRLADELARANEELSTTAAAADAARALAEHANRAKSDFLAVMSHELRTPLNAIGGYVELLEIGIRGPVTQAQREDLERIQRAQRHLLVLISEVLNFARLEAGQVSYDSAAIPVDSLLRGLEPLVAPQLQARGLRYSYDCTPARVTAWADREKLEQILLNLLSNAIKFTPPGGVVTLACEADDERVRIQVRDTGVGIPPDKLERVFEPFVQLDQSLTRSRDGVGLGLAISHDLARGMKGDLTVESEPGVGTAFTLTLPAGSDSPRTGLSSGTGSSL